MSQLISIEYAPLKATGTIPGSGRWYHDFNNLKRTIINSEEIGSVSRSTDTTIDLRKKGQRVADNCPWGMICAVSIESFTRQMQENKHSSLVYIISDPQPIFIEPEQVS